MTALRGPGAASRTRSRVLTALLALLLSAPALGACSQIQDRAGDLAEHAIEEAIDGLDLTDGLPPDFPAEQVPVTDGRTRGASQTTEDATGWVVLVAADSSGAHARDLLTDAGLEVTHTVTVDAGLLAELSGSGYNVKLIATSTQVVYVVTPS